MTPIETIKATITIPELWRRLDPAAVVNVGANLCPFHNEKTPSCNINKDMMQFHCFGCGAGGTVIDFYRFWTKIEKVSDVVREMCQLLSINGEKPDHKPLARHTQKPVIKLSPKSVEPVKTDSQLDHAALDFFARKDISTETALRVLGEGDMAFSGGVMAFNYNTGVKLRPNYETSRDNRWLKGNPIDGLWRLEAIKRFSVKAVWIAEGETDTMRLMDYIPKTHEAVGIPNASWIMSPKLAGLIANNRFAIICTDDDVAGRKSALAIEQAIRVHSRNSTVVLFPWAYRPRAEDENDDICKLKKETLKNLIDLTLSTHNVPV